MHMVNTKLKYIYIPIIFTLIGYVVIYVSFLPVFRIAGAFGSMLISKSEPDFNTEMSVIFDPEAHKAVLSQDDTINEADIQKPRYGNAYANIECEEVSMNQPIYWGDTNAVLDIGIGQYAGSYYPGYGKAILICGHNVSFGRYIKDTKVGMVYKVTTNYGVFEYEVYDIKIMSASEAEKQVSGWLLAQEEKLIYYTCYPFDTYGITTQRCFVFAKKISGPVVVS